MANDHHLKFLLAGGSKWLTWRDENPDVIPDFTHHRFSKVSFKFRPIRKANFDDTTFDDVDLSVADLDGSSFCNSRFKNVDLKATRFAGCKLINVVFEDCNLEKTNFSNAILENVKFANTDLIETIFDGATLANIELVKSTLKNVNLLEAIIVSDKETIFTKLKNEQKLLQQQEEVEKIRREKEFDDKVQLIKELQSYSDSISLKRNELLELERNLNRRLEVFRNNRKYENSIKEELRNLNREIKHLKREQKRLDKRLKGAESIFQEIGAGNFESDKGGYAGAIAYRKVSLRAEPPKDELKEAADEIERVLDEVKKDEIDISVYTSPTVKPAEPLMVQVWLHQPKLIEEVEEAALNYDFEATIRGKKSLLLVAPKGTEFTLQLTCSQIGYEKAINTIWNGQKMCETFMVNIPEDISKSALFMTVEVYQGGLPIGNINFKMKVVPSNYPTNVDKKETIGRSKKYEKAFISYSSNDREEVLARVQGIKLTDKYDIFQDVISLEEGDRWQPRIYQEIERSDVFFLFWSEAARDSEWVRKELEYALKCKEGVEENNPKIQPVVLPPMVDPPKSLGYMHFNDSIVQFIMAERFRKKQAINN